MKRFLLTLSLLILPTLTQADPYKQAANSYVWSPTLTGAATMGFQIFNPSTTALNKSIYITGISVTSTGPGYFTVYSTNTGAGFTGTKVLDAAANVTAGSSNVSISSVTTVASASLPTGSIVWQGVILASTTFNALQTTNYPFVLAPGNALYVIKTNAGAQEKAAVSFYWTENYR